MSEMFKGLYNIFSGKDLEIAEKIQRRRLQILIHSCIYYELDRNIISDMQWDKWAKELVVLQRENPEIAKKVCFSEAFNDWDASTGAFLPLKDPWVYRKATLLCSYHVKKKPKQIKDTKQKSKTVSMRLF